MKLMNDIPVFGEADENTLQQMANCMAPDFTYGGALMADNHLGYSMPIGGVIAYHDYISPSGVGYDIGCGNKAVRTNLTYADIKKDLPRIVDQIAAQISFGMGRTNDDPEAAEHGLFDNASWNIPELYKIKQKARSQLGTVGSGNHYVDLFREEGYHAAPLDSDPIWVGVHFGSRGLGHTIASGYMSVAQGGEFGAKVKGETMMSDPILIAVDSELGQHYIAGMELAGQYAYAGRDYVVNRVLGILGAQSNFEVHNHHNYAWLEEHGGNKVWVVRKGATPAYPGQMGFIGGSMGSYAVIIEGLDSDLSDSALNSTMHGAGRVMSRTQAKGKIRKRNVYECTARECDFNVPAKEYQPGRTQCPVHPHKMTFRKIVKETRVSEGRVDFDAVKRRLTDQHIELRGAGADEAPEVYKDLTEVLTAHSGTIQVKHILNPIGVVMAGADVFDPFKD